MGDKANNPIWGIQGTRTQGPITSSPMAVAGGLLSTASSPSLLLLKDRTGSEVWNKAVSTKAVHMVLPVRTAEQRVRQVIVDLEQLDLGWEF